MLCSAVEPDASFSPEAGGAKPPQPDEVSASDKSGDTHHRRLLPFLNSTTPVAVLFDRIFNLRLRARPRAEPGVCNCGTSLGPARHARTDRFLARAARPRSCALVRAHERAQE